MAPKSSKTVMWFYMFNFFITILLCTFSQPNFDQESKYLNHFIFCLFFILGRKHNKRNGNFWYSPLTANMSKLKPKVRGLLFSCQSVRHEMTHIDVSLGAHGWPDCGGDIAKNKLLTFPNQDQSMFVRDVNFRFDLPDLDMTSMPSVCWDLILLPFYARWTLRSPKINQWRSAESDVSV